MFNPEQYSIGPEQLISLMSQDPNGIGKILAEKGVDANQLSQWAVSVDQNHWTPEKVSSELGLPLSSSYTPVGSVPLVPSGTGISPAQMATTATTATAATGSPGIQLFNPSAYPRSRSGLPDGYLNQIMGAVIPEFSKSITGLDSNISGYFNKAKQNNLNQTQDLLHTVLQSSLNSLASRGMATSKVASTALGTASGNVLKNVLNQNLQTGIAEANARTNLPSSLGQLLQLGKVSTSSDPSAPFRDLLSIF